jgi:hypothetical protein
MKKPKHQTDQKASSVKEEDRMVILVAAASVLPLRGQFRRVDWMDRFVEVPDRW